MLQATKLKEEASVPNIFQVRTKPGGVNRVSDFVEKGFVAIGWTETESLEGVDKEGIRERLKQLGYEGQQLSNYLGTLNTFVNVMEEGDIVLVADGDVVHIGIVGPYEWREDLKDIRCAHYRKCDWKAVVKRSELNEDVQGLLRSGTTCTKFKYSYEFSGLDKYLKNEKEGKKEEMDEFQKELEREALEKAKELLKSDDERIRLEAVKEILHYLKDSKDS